MRKTIYLFLTTFLLVSHFLNAQQYQQFAITGFNADVIANGEETTAAASTTNDVDGSNFVYYTAGWTNASAVAPINGVPENRILNGLSSYPGLTFLLAEYNLNNSVRLGDSTPVEISITNGAPVKKLFLAATAGNGGTSGRTVSCVVKFSDNTTQTNVIAVLDWYSNTNPITSNLGRVNRVTEAIGASEGAKIHQYEIPINIENQTKTITAIEFTRTATAGVPNIFAISAELTPSCPSPLSTDISSTTTMDSAVVSWEDALIVPSGGYDYYWTTSAEIPGTDQVPTGNTTANSVSFSDLTTGTTYYFWIRSNCGSNDLGSWSLHNVVPGTATVIYTDGDIPTQFGISNTYCTPEATLTVAVPEGYWIASASTSYNMTAHGGAYRSEQRSLVYSTSHNTGEASLSNGSGLAGVHQYNRALGFAEGLTGTVDFVLRTWRTWGGSGCGTSYNYVNNNTWTLTVTFEPKPPLCDVPDPVENLSIDGATKTITFSTDDEPTGFLIIRSTSETLTEGVVNEMAYSVGQSLGGGEVVYNGSETEYVDSNTASNTTYYYHVYAYNYSNSLESPCLYTYSGVVTESITTCADAPILVGESNVKTNGAILNWDHALYSNTEGLTYDIEISKNADFSILDFSGAGQSAITYTLTELESNTIYYWRVKTVTEGSCDSDWVSTSFVTESSYSPIAVTGYTDDVIADGIGLALSSTTNSVDSSAATDNFAYMSNSFKPTPATNITYALPVNRILESPSIPGLRFMIPDYSGNNSLRLSVAGESKTLTFVEPLKLTDVYFAFTSGSGASVVTAEIEFEDGTSQEVTGISLADWFATQSQAGPNLPILASNLGRVKRSDSGIQAGGAPNSNTSNAKIFQLTVPINEENHSKLVTGVTFTRTSTNNTFPNIFAISGKIIGGCPILGNTSPEVVATTTAQVEWTLSSPGENYSLDEISYILRLYSDADHTVQVGETETGIEGLTYTFEGLTPETTYYYTVVADNGACTSVEIDGSFTTQIACPVPTGLTVSDITLSSAVISWNATTPDNLEGYTYEIRTSGTPGSGEDGLVISDSLESITTVSIEDLISGTTYYAYISANCGVDGDSVWSSGVSFVPDWCTPTHDLAFSSGYRITTVSFVDFNVVDNIPSYTDRNRTNIAIPAFEAGNSYTIEATATGWTAVGIAADFNNNGNFSDDGEILALPDYIAQDPALYNMTITIPEDVPAGTYRLRLWNREANAGAGTDPCGHYTRGTWADYLITVIASADPDCVPVENVTIAHVSTNSAEVSWDSEGTSFVVVYTLSGSGVQEGTSENVSETNILLEDLVPNTSYDVFIRNICGDESFSVWSQVATFTTCPVLEITEETKELPQGSTVENLMEENEEIVWYANEEDALAQENPLMATDLLVNGQNYYGVHPMENGCVAMLHIVTVELAVSNQNFDTKELVYYPNPVKEVLHMSYNATIDAVEVFNTLGQKVKSEIFSADKVQLDLNGLAAGTYMIRVYSNDQSHIIKVLKK